MDINTLQEQASKLLVDAQALLTSDNFTSEINDQAQRMLVDAGVIEQRIAGLVKIEASQKAARSFERSARPVVNANGAVEIDQLTPEARKTALNTAWRSYARHGFQGMKSEQRDLLTTSDVTGGALIPQEFLGTLIEATKFYGPIAAKVAQKVTNNNGRPIKISYANDTANGLSLLATEGTSGPVETDPGFFSKILGVDTVTGGLVKVSFEELEDSAFDLDTWLRTAFSTRFARGIEKAVTVGTDSNGTALPNQATGGLVSSAVVGQTTSALAAGIGWDDLTYTFSSLDPSYVNAQSAWVMNSATRNYLVGLKDGFGRPFFTPDPANTNPFGRLLGYDIVLDQSVPAYNATAPVANQIPILFGDLEKSYMLRTDGVPSILRLNERYADTLEVGFYMYTRIGGISLNAGIGTLASLKLAAA